jgi:hypothetical protein
VGRTLKEMCAVTDVTKKELGKKQIFFFNSFGGGGFFFSSIFFSPIYVGRGQIVIYRE